MTDALMKMGTDLNDRAYIVAWPYDDTDPPVAGHTYTWKDAEKPLRSVEPSNWRVMFDRLRGFLPLPADPSSAAVAKTAGEWLSVCDPKHRMTMLQMQMDRMTPEELIEVERHIEDRRMFSDMLDHVATELSKEDHTDD